MKFSDQEQTLLRILQGNAALSLAELAEQSGMATSTVWRKMQEFENIGLLKGRVALLDPAKADTRLCVFATVRLADHAEASIAGFATIIRSHPEIMEAHAISGTADYILKIRCKDVEAYEAFMTHTLLRSPLVKSVVSSFSLKELKYTTALPL
ncbi:Lrp/AsnC family transcriptional regulator [Cognatiyoonia sp. IB215446]|uniref:Lrp/AsnC family transcriptional regulator n=1 Tax=Cognatiyoonia sp. IB215446 TaxID=3097355 RepID=UPI002A13331A|nr:Lrp/AsnC family transcriptional regulator [Cognatiyoonia sp. IB215446]MDX8347895.1 Lrp/AsnC family transcriptional regulator [Cognatiyoonia sp. IB215446]